MSLDSSLRPVLVRGASNCFWQRLAQEASELTEPPEAAGRVVSTFRSSHEQFLRRLNLEQVDRLCGEVLRLLEKRVAEHPHQQGPLQQREQRVHTKELAAGERDKQ
eukprot:GHVT01027714.1.p2 GENE.GHVT01027714.1~~GHVT01027714.1.p2  ORF type:complete len:106 (+),score=29.71 GHVT01027714.1:213-530(+)